MQLPGFPRLPVDPSTSFAGRTVLITGSNTGLGLAAAQKFANLGASRLILAVRSLEKGAKAREQIESNVRVGQDTGSGATATTGGTVIEVWQLDMGDYESIRAFAARAAKELERLDVVILNAGVWKRAFGRSKYGWEEILQVNLLSTTLLAVLLLPVLRRSGARFPDPEGRFPVLELVSSGMHYRAPVSKADESGDVKLLERQNSPEGFAGTKQYSLSKLFLMYALAELKKLEDSFREVATDDSDGGGEMKANGEGNVKSEGRVWVTSVCPGFCNSDLGRDFNPWLVKMAVPVLGLMGMRTSEQGSRSYVSGVTQGEKGHGRFWQHDEIREPHTLLQGEVGQRMQKEVWGEIVEALTKDVPDFEELLERA